MKNNKKILILTGSFGNGHISVTNSIVNQFSKMNLSHLTVIEHDLFLEAHPILTSIAKKYYINSYKYFRKSYSKFYYSKPDELDKCFYKYYGLNKLVNLLIKEKPDLILLTFPTPVVSVLTKELGLNIPIVTVITDYHLHKNWVNPGTSRYYVAAECTKKDLMEVGIEPYRIKVTGIPVHPRFEMQPKREDWLIEQKLDPNKKTVLMVAGAFGVVEGFSDMLSGMNARLDAQFVVVCGNNQKLIKSLQSEFNGADNIHIIGYTNEMNEWMAAADLMLTKPGGITITESLKRAVPLVFFNPAPGQEGENAIYFSHQGYARITHTISETEHVMIDLLEHDNERQAMKTAMAASQLPSASKAICDDIIDMLGASETHVIHSRAALYARLFAR